MKENGTEERSCIQAEEKEEFCTVKNVLPGQHLSLMITKVRKGKGRKGAAGSCSLHPTRFRLPAPISETAAAVHTWPCLMKTARPERKTGERIIGQCAFQTGTVMGI